MSLQLLKEEVDVFNKNLHPRQSWYPWCGKCCKPAQICELKLDEGTQKITLTVGCHGQSEDLEVKEGLKPSDPVNFPDWVFVPQGKLREILIRAYDNPFPDDWEQRWRPMEEHPPITPLVWGKINVYAVNHDARPDKGRKGFGTCLASITRNESGQLLMHAFFRQAERDGERVPMTVVGVIEPEHYLHAWQPIPSFSQDGQEKLIKQMQSGTMEISDEIIMVNR